jgi:hypothetical protein
MTWLKRLAYMGFGASLVIVLAMAGVVVFAQSDGDGGDEAPELLEDQSGPWRFRRGPFVDVDEQALLAEALGITVEELQAAHEEVRVAAIEQALAEGLISEEEAEALIEDGFGPRVRWGVNSLIDKDEALAEALGISVEELQAAQSEVYAARLEALVEDGVLTQEQADLAAARRAVREYIDAETLQATVQDAYEAAVEQALEDGAISEEQAEQLQDWPAYGGPLGLGFGEGHAFREGQGYGEGFQFGPGRGNRNQHGWGGGA